MSRQAIPYIADDVSVLARALKRELARFDEEEKGKAGPGHVDLLNMLARAGGYRNFQHMKAQADARERLDRPLPQIADAAVDYVQIARVARYFDADGKLARWPAKHSHRVLCLWVLWSRLEPRHVYSEAEINRALNAEHLFGDHALLRRDLCDLGLMVRRPDGSEYRRIERAPPADAAALIGHVGGRQMA